jgi:hypothetical protein
MVLANKVAWNYLTSTSNPSAEPETTTSDIDTIALYVHNVQFKIHADL